MNTYPTMTTDTAASAANRTFSTSGTARPLAWKNASALPSAVAVMTKGNVMAA